MIFVSSVSSTEFDTTKIRQLQVEMIQNHTEPQTVVEFHRKSQELNGFIMIFPNL